MKVLLIVGLIVLSLVIGGVVGLLVGISLGNRLAESRNQDLVQILVTRMRIPRGELLARPEDGITVKEFRKDTCPPNAILSKDIANLKNKIAARDMDEGHIVTLRDFEDSGMMSAIPEGHLALAIALSRKHDGFGGVLKIRPGNRVDVIADVPDLKAAQQGKTVPATVLQDVLVLGVDLPTNDSAPGHSVGIMTLAVKPDAALVMHEVMKTSPLTVALRRPGDHRLPFPPYPPPVDENGAPKGREFVRILIAFKDVPAHTYLEYPEDYFRLLEVPLVFPEVDEAIRTFAELKGKKTKGLVLKGLPITRQHLADSPEQP